MPRLRLPAKLWPPVFDEHPFPLVLGVWGVLAGLLVLIGAVEPASFGALSWLSEDAWGALTAASGAAVLLGLAARARDLRPLAWGLTALAFAFAVYALAAVHSVGWHQAGVTALLRFSLAAACLGHAAQLFARELLADQAQAGATPRGGT